MKVDPCPSQCISSVIHSTQSYHTCYPGLYITILENPYERWRYQDFIHISSGDFWVCVEAYQSIEYHWNVNQVTNYHKPTVSSWPGNRHMEVCHVMLVICIWASSNDTDPHYHDATGVMEGVIPSSCKEVCITVQYKTVIFNQIKGQTALHSWKLFKPTQKNTLFH